MNATRLESPSEIGILIQIPSALKKYGNMSRPGNRKSNCLVSDMNTDFPANPTLWKKFPVTIWKPTIGKQANTILIPRIA